MSHRQFVRYCQLTGTEPIYYEEISYPHPYLLIWLECRRQANAVSGVASYPEPEKGWLDQDGDLLLAIEVLNELYDEHSQREEKRKKLIDQTGEILKGQ